MAQAPGNGAGAKNGARHPPLAPSPSAEKRTHQPPVFLGGVSGEYDFPGASAGALYDGFHPGGTPIPVTAASAYRSPTTTGDARVAEDATSRRASQLKRCRGAGFIAALDQSGGSTPRALSLYGINDIRADDKDAMFDAVHAMRTRIVTADAFDGAKIFGAILFQDTVFHRLVQGKKPTATYLWEDKGIVPFLKIDKGLQPEADGVQLMKPIPELDRTLSWCGGSGGGRGGGTKDPGSLEAVLDIADELVSFFLFPRMGNWFDVLFLTGHSRRRCFRRRLRFRHQGSERDSKERPGRYRSCRDAAVRRRGARDPPRARAHHRAGS